MSNLTLFDEVKTLSALGKPFVIKECCNCSQLILIDPEYYREDHDKLCEACNIKTANKYMKFLKLKL